jgi:hypothetical protein
MENRERYDADIDRDMILLRLLESFTPGQLLKLAEKMSLIIDRRYAKVEIEIHGDRMFIWAGPSDDCGNVRGR